MKNTHKGEFVILESDIAPLGRYYLVQSDILLYRSGQRGGKRQHRKPENFKQSSFNKLFSEKNYFLQFTKSLISKTNVVKTLQETARNKKLSAVEDQEKQRLKQVDDHISKLKEKHKAIWRNSVNIDDYSSKSSLT